MDTDVFYTTLLIVGLIWIFSQTGKKNEGKERREGFDEVLSEIPHVWNPEDLENFLWFEEGAWDEEGEYEEDLLKAYHRQRLLLMKIKHGDPEAIAIAAKTIQRHLGESPSRERMDQVRDLFAWVLDRQPDLEKIFQEEEEMPEGYASHRSNLFAKCATVDEVKRRFRRLSLLNHPDKGGSAAAMKIILEQYERSMKRFQ